MPRPKLPISVQTFREIREQLNISQQALGLVCEEPSVDGCFAELIRKAHAATGERVVVLVDEYDKPILDNLTDPVWSMSLPSAATSPPILPRCVPPRR